MDQGDEETPEEVDVIQEYFKQNPLEDEKAKYFLDVSILTLNT